MEKKDLIEELKKAKLTDAQLYVPVVCDKCGGTGQYSAKYPCFKCNGKDDTHLPAGQIVAERLYSAVAVDRLYKIHVQGQASERHRLYIIEKFPSMHTEILRLMNGMANGTIPIKVL